MFITLGVRSCIQPDLKTRYIPSHISKVNLSLDRPLKPSTWNEIILEINVLKYVAIGLLYTVGTMVTHIPYPFPVRILFRSWPKFFVCEDDLYLASLVIQN